MPHIFSMIDSPYLLSLFFLLILHGHMIELKCVTIDKENECTIEIELLVMELKLVSFSRPELGNSIEKTTNSTQFNSSCELSWIELVFFKRNIELNWIELKICLNISESSWIESKNF